jgi:eukaryotic-like serine/threonine-protein kinase
MIGKTISHYKILSKLGEGGMGVVYKALDLKLERTVALKFLPHEIAISDEDKARFLQEAKAASAISHPNVCVIHDILESDGQQFIVMEYVDGKTLRQMVPIPRVQDALGYAIQIGEALAEAHGKGVVHRDVKTDNIMVNVANQIKVMDFGLAKLRGSLKLTRTSSTVGTLSYMAPEQIRGGEVDARSDIFSFGVVLYEMLTGRIPFVGDHEAAMMYSIMNDSPQPVQKFRPDLSSEVLHIINRALEKDPEDRYQSMLDMVIDLRRARKESSRVSRPAMGVPVSPEARAVGGGSEGTPLEQGPSTGRMPILEQTVPGTHTGRAPRRIFLWIGLAAVLAAAVIAAFLIVPRRAPRLNPDLSFRPLAIPFTQIETAGLSRDGSWVAFDVRDPNDDFCSVYFMNVAKGAPRRLTTVPYRWIYSTEVSPDGSEVLYDGILGASPCAVFLVSSLGGASRKIAERGLICKWRPDGKLIGYIKGIAFYAPSASGKREFWTVKPDGSENRLQFIDSLSYLGYTNLCFAWSPDGTSIAWLRGWPDRNEIIIRDLKSGTERQLTSFKLPITGVQWASNGRIFLSIPKSGSTSIWMIPAKGGEAVQVTKGAGPDYVAGVSADANRLLYMEARRIDHVWTAGIDGRSARQLTFDNLSLGTPSMSPDKERICFYVQSWDVLHPTCHVYMMNSDGSNRIQVTSGEEGFYNPAWSPDGAHIAYCGYPMNEPSDSARVYVVDATNPGSPRIVGRGDYVLWINAEEIVALKQYGFLSSIRYSIRTGEPLEVSPDSTAWIPLPDGIHRLVCDLRSKHKGWWLETPGAPAGAPPKLLVPEQYCDATWPSSSLRYLLSRQEDSELYRISILEGKRERLPEFLSGRNPFDFEVQMSYDDRELVFVRMQENAKLVLIDNLFK